jgi:hypothetical protein
MSIESIQSPTFADPASDPEIRAATEALRAKEKELASVQSEIQELVYTPKLAASRNDEAAAEVVGAEAIQSEIANLADAKLNKTEGMAAKLRREERLAFLRERQRVLPTVIWMQGNVIAKLTAEFSRTACEAMQPRLVELATDAAAKLRAALDSCDAIAAFFDDLETKRVVHWEQVLPSIRPHWGTFCGKKDNYGEPVGIVAHYLKELEKSGMVRGIPRPAPQPQQPTPAAQEPSKVPRKRNRWIRG